ncbi:MAG: hypothetical protein ABFD75_14225 [Smithella sp.]
MAIAELIDIKNNIAQRSTQRLNFNPVAQAATSYTTDSNKTVETSSKKSGLTVYSFGQMPVYANAPGYGSMGGGVPAAESETMSASGGPTNEDTISDTVSPAEETREPSERDEIAAAREEEPSQPGVIEPVRIVRDVDLWWFDGEDAANYDEEAKLTAFGGRPGATRGRFEWDIVRGADKIDFQNASDSMVRTNANRITIWSTDASVTRGDVKVRCRWSLGGLSRTLYHEFTVYAPDEAVVVNGPNDSPWNGGYQSQYTIEARDQFHQPLPREVEVNENWETFTADQPVVVDWMIAPPNGTMTGTPATAQFYETYGMPAGPGRTPQAVNPGDPGAATPVMHAFQQYRAGSTTVGDGRLIKRHVTTYYRGQGRQ